MHSYTGIVEHGTKRAAKLGFPTINIPLEDTEVSGIYAARVKVEGKEYLAAMFADPKRKLLEAYILDFSGELYGKEIDIELHEKVRESQQFSDDATLRTAIADDIAKVRAYFKAPPLLHGTEKQE